MSRNRPTISTSQRIVGCQQERLIEASVFPMLLPTPSRQPRSSSEQGLTEFDSAS